MFLRSILKEISLPNTPKWSKKISVSQLHHDFQSPTYDEAAKVQGEENLFICNFLAAPKISTQNLGSKKKLILPQLIECSKPWVLMLLKFVELDFYLPIYSNYSSCCKILNGMPFKQHLLYQGNRFFQLLSPRTNTLCTPHGEWCSPTSAGSPAPHRAAWASTKG